MMVPTHVLLGGLVGALYATHEPAAAPGVVFAGMAGGLLPDLDMVRSHRKTLHYPVLGLIGAMATGLVDAVVAAPVVGEVFVAVVAAGLHAWMDVLGGGKELRPWRRTDDRAVYDHVRRRWIPARRVFYDGSPLDLVLSGLAAGLLVATAGGAIRPLAVVLFGVALVYAVGRTRVAELIGEEFPTYSAYVRYRLEAARSRFT